MENVAILRKWEHLEKNIANFKNHRRFTLRCLSQKLTPNCLKLKSNIKTTRGKKILEKAERQLANERVRNISNTIETCSWQRNTCIDELKDQISLFYFQESVKFVERVKETRHQTVLKRHLSKFEQLWQRFRGACSNITTKNGHSKILHRKQGEITSSMVLETTEDTPNTTPTTATTTTADTATSKEYINRWVRNLSRTPLTEVQVSLLVHGPNFAVAPRHPPWGIHHCNRASLHETRAPQCRRV